MSIHSTGHLLFWWATGNKQKFHQSFIVSTSGTKYTKCAQVYFSLILMKAPSLSSFTTLFVASLLVSIVTTGSTYFTQAAQAQLIEPPPDHPAPQTTTSGGTRPIDRTCLQQSNQSAPTALASLRSVGFTMHDRPTVWIYLPSTSAKTLEFSVFDQNRRGIYQTSIAIDNQTGFVPISLPSSAPALIQNQPYYWSVALICDANQRTNDWIIGGWIQQRSVDPDLERQLKKATLIEHIRLAAAAGYWYEAVDAYLRSQSAKQSDPQLKKMWTNLLEIGKLRSVLSKAN